MNTEITLWDIRQIFTGGLISAIRHYIWIKIELRCNVGYMYNKYFQILNAVMLNHWITHWWAICYTYLLVRVNLYTLDNPQSLIIFLSIRFHFARRCGLWWSNCFWECHSHKKVCMLSCSWANICLFMATKQESEIKS